MTNTKDMGTKISNAVHKVTDPVEKQFKAVGDAMVGSSSGKKRSGVPSTANVSKAAEVSALTIEVDENISNTNTAKTLFTQTQDAIDETAALLAAVPKKTYDGTKKVYKGTRDAVIDANTQFFKLLIPVQKEEEKKKKDDEEAEEEDADTGKKQQPALPDDKQLCNMDTVFTKTLKNISVRDWYETCWSEGVNTDKPPMYGKWLKEYPNNFDFDIPDWTFAPVVNDYDQEEYDQKRCICFKFERTNTPFMPGPAKTFNTHEQYCRLIPNEEDSSEGDKEKSYDRCIVANKITTKGVPFGDTFHVHIRWVATRLGKRDLRIQVGLFVLFVKPILMASKVRDIAGKLTTNSQLDFFKQMKTVFGAVESEDMGEEGEDGKEGSRAASSINKGILELFFDFLLSLWFVKVLRNIFDGGNATNAVGPEGKVFQELMAQQQKRFDEMEQTIKALTKESASNANVARQSLEKMEVLQGLVQQLVKAKGV